MTVPGHPAFFHCLDKREETASPKTPMQWHKTCDLSHDNGLGFVLTTESWLMGPSRELSLTGEMTTRILA